MAWVCESVEKRLLYVMTLFVVDSIVLFLPFNNLNTNINKNSICQTYSYFAREVAYFLSAGFML